MAWLGWTVSVILAFGALFLHYRSQEAKDAIAAASAGHEANAAVQSKKVAELEEAIAALRAREKVRNAIDAAKVKTVPGAIDYVRDAFGQLHPDRPGSSGSGTLGLSTTGLADRTRLGSLRTIGW